MRHGTSNNRRHRNRNNNGRRNNQPRTQVYDSNGPDVRIRGTANQVAEKYLTLAMDATSLGDNTIAENYYQHAEHYIRIISENNSKIDANRGTQDTRHNQSAKSNESTLQENSKSEKKDDLSLPNSILGSEVTVQSKKIDQEETAD